MSRLCPAVTTVTTGLHGYGCMSSYKTARLSLLLVADVPKLHGQHVAVFWLRSGCVFA